MQVTLMICSALVTPTLPVRAVTCPMLTLSLHQWQQDVLITCMQIRLSQGWAAV